MKSRDGRLLDLYRLGAIASNPAVYRLASAIPQRTHSIGRPRQFPDEAYALFAVVIAAVGSARKAAGYMEEPFYWNILREGMRVCLGDEFIASVPSDRGPTRNQWLYHSRRFARHISEVAEVFRSEALGQALEAGHFDPTRRWRARPDRADMLAADGTVVTSPLRGPSARRSKPSLREDTGSGWHVEGGEDANTTHFGSKFIFVSTRTAGKRHSRIVLDVRHQPPGKGYGGEAGIAVAAIADLHAKAPDVRGACYDGAFRGKHINALMKRGLIVVCPQHGSTKPRALERITCACGRPHDLWTANGAVHIRRIDATGAPGFEPLPIIKIEKRGRAQSHRWSHLLRLPCGAQHRVRLDTSTTDLRNDFNRAEHLSQHPPGSDGYRALYGFREDAESLHATLDRTLWGGRMIAFGAARQTLIMIGFAIAQNSLERWFRRAEAAPPDVS